jgi:hypothetical protein
MCTYMANILLHTEHALIYLYIHIYIYISYIVHLRTDMIQRMQEYS